MLHDKDLQYCDWLAYAIQTTTNKPVYLSHSLIPWQLKKEARECLNTWPCQGIRWPSMSPYDLQVVIMCMKIEKLIYVSIIIYYILLL